VQNAIIGDDNSVTGGLIGAATLLLVNYFVVRNLYGHSKLETMVEGKEDVLIEKGKVLERRLKKELITMAELQAAAHRQGFASLSEVDRSHITGSTRKWYANSRPSRATTRSATSRSGRTSLGDEMNTLRILCCAMAGW
jgi:hypothetical protein